MHTPKPNKILWKLLNQVENGEAAKPAFGLPQHNTTVIANDTIVDSATFGAQSMFSTPNPFGDPVNYNGVAFEPLPSQPDQRMNGFSNQFNGFDADVNTTEAVTFNPFTILATETPPPVASHYVDYNAIRATLNNGITLTVSPTETKPVPPEARVNDKAAMDFFKDAAAAAFNQFGGKSNSTFNVRTNSPRSMASEQSGLSDGKVMPGINGNLTIFKVVYRNL